MDTGPIRVEWSGDAHLRVCLGADRGEATHRRVMRAMDALRRAAIAGVEDLTPAYATLLVSVRIDGHEPAAVRDAVEKVLKEPNDMPEAEDPRVVEIPVCYERSLAPDLDDLARLAGVPVGEIASRHCAAEYVVRFLGFSPGFAYLAGLPDELRAPRLDRPRPRVPAGSVAIADDQTGIYPRQTPGGWRLIGRTPLNLFDADREPPSLLRAGDRVRFVAIDGREFETLARRSG